MKRVLRCELLLALTKTTWKPIHRARTDTPVSNQPSRRRCLHINTCLSFPSPSATLPLPPPVSPKNKWHTFSNSKGCSSSFHNGVHRKGLSKISHNYHVFHNIVHLPACLLCFLNQRPLIAGRLTPLLLLWVNESRGNMHGERNQSNLSLKSCSPREATMTPPLFPRFTLTCFLSPICATPVFPLFSQVCTQHIFLYSFASKPQLIHWWPSTSKKQISQRKAFVNAIFSSWSVSPRCSFWK